MNRLKTWFNGLTKTKKITVITIASILLLGSIGSMGQAKPSPVDSNVGPAKVQTQQPKIETKTVTATEPVLFTSSTVDDSNLAQGTTAVRTAGVNGVRTLTYEITLTNGVETARKEVNNVVTTPPVNEVVAKGTKAPQSNCNPNYSPCVPNSASDLDCKDIGFTVKIVGVDVYRLDKNKDGYGCE